VIAGLVPAIVESLHGEEEVVMEMGVVGDIFYDSLDLVESDLAVVFYFEIAACGHGGAEVFCREGGGDHDGVGFRKCCPYVAVDSWEGKDVKEAGVDIGDGMFLDVLVVFADEPAGGVWVQTGIFFDAGEVLFHRWSHDIGGLGEVEVLAAPVCVGADAEDAVGVGVVFVIAGLVEDVERYEEEAGQADGEADEVD